MSLCYPLRSHSSISHCFKSVMPLSPSLLLFLSYFTTFKNQLLQRIQLLLSLALIIIFCHYKKAYLFTCIHFSFFTNENSYSQSLILLDETCLQCYYCNLLYPILPKYHFPCCKPKISFSWHLATLQYLC